MSSASNDRGMASTAVSPGPAYLPESRHFPGATGPKGMGVEFSISPSFRYPTEEMKTTQAEKPGPKYDLPSGLGKQYESTKRSFGAGKISQAPRKTIDTTMFPGCDSRGPAAYNRTSLGLKTMVKHRTPAPVTTGLGAADRFYDSEGRSRAIPGPGAYPVPQSIGGKGMPHKKAAPVYQFSKADRDSTASLPVDSSPGPVYKVPAAIGPQVDGRRKQAPIFGFGTAARFPVSPAENRVHLQQVKAVKKKMSMSTLSLPRNGSRPSTGD